MHAKVHHATSRIAHTDSHTQPAGASIGSLLHTADTRGASLHRRIRVRRSALSRVGARLGGSDPGSTKSTNTAARRVVEERKPVSFDPATGAAVPFSDVPPSFVYDTPQLLRAPVQARIVNGQEVFPAGKYPWMVGIVGVRTNFLGEEDESFWCGGTLVSPDFVMSASHCFVDTAGVPAATPFDFFRVKLGAHDIDEPELEIDVALEDIAGQMDTNLSEAEMLGLAAAVIASPAPATITQLPLATRAGKQSLPQLKPGLSQPLWPSS